MRHGPAQLAIPAPYALPVGFAMFLAVGTVAAALHGRLPATGVLIACAAVAGGMSFAAEPVASVLLAGRRARRRCSWRVRAGRRRVRPGVPLVLATTHTGKHGYAHARRTPGPEEGRPA